LSGKVPCPFAPDSGDFRTRREREDLRSARRRAQNVEPEPGGARRGSCVTSAQRRVTVVHLSPWTAQRLGGIVGAALAITFVIWSRTRATPCPGAVTLEFHPPLVDRGSYRIELSWPGANPCQFTVDLPLDVSPKNRGKTGCGMALELRTQVQDGQASVTGLTFAAAPEQFRLRVQRGAEPIYDALLEPKFAPYPTTRAEDKHFCGDRALVLAPCLRGSSACAPFPARCTGPQDCEAKRVCCLTPEWGRDFGSYAASECTSSNSCLSHLGHLACRDDNDCPSAMRCGDTSLAAEFSKPVQACH